MSRIGLALSGGAARGLAHIGVLKALKEESIPVNIIGGTSAGAAIGACYAKHKDVAILEDMALGMDWKKLLGLIDLNLVLLGKGFLQGHKVKSLLAACLGGDVDFRDLQIPLAAVAADVDTMEEVVIEEGSVVEAVRASISLPVVFTPVKWGNRFLIDGGVVNPMPTDVVRGMGADIVVAVNVLYIAQPKRQKKAAGIRGKAKRASRRESTYLSVVKRKVNSLLRVHGDKVQVFSELCRITEMRLHSGRGKVDPETPGIFEVLMQIMHALQYERTRLATQYADLVIYPDVSRVRAFDFPKAEEIIMAGYKAAKQMMPRLEEVLRSAPIPPPVRNAVHR